jgi:hypothetical protein
MRKRDAFPSRYFKATDFPDTPMVLEIETVRYEKFDTNGKSDGQQEKPVVYFVGQKSGLVIGPTVWDQIAEVTGSDDTKDWPHHHVELYRTKTQFGRDIVDCIRVRAPGTTAKPKPKPKKKPDPKPDYNDEVQF